jgi:D-alanine-D-alanine ligase
MALNKRVAKEIYRGAGLEVIRDRVVRKGGEVPAEEIFREIGPSTVVKPVSEGSSLGMSVCHSLDELISGIEEAFRHDDTVIIEAYIRGREVTCGVLGNRDVEALPLVEIIPEPESAFFDYRAKYTPGAAKELCPAPISEDQADRVKECAKRAHLALECSVWSRTDMILAGDSVYILETNTIPGMTETSLVPLAARKAGLSLAQLLDRLIELALEAGRSEVG